MFELGEALAHPLEGRCQLTELVLARIHDRLAEVFTVNEEYDHQLSNTYAEIDRLNTILHQIYGSHTWKLHLLLDRVRGR